MDSAFPQILDDIDIVFDLAWSISKTSQSITSALSQSDIVLVPIYNKVKSIKAGLNTIAEIMPLNKNIIVVATKLQKRNKIDRFKNWLKCEDYQNIKSIVETQIGKSVPALSFRPPQ